MERARPAPAMMRFGVFELDPVAGELRRAGVRIRLPEQSLRILVMLLERPGTVVTREELRHGLWPDGTFVEFDHSLNAAINRLRAALGDAAENPRFVETLAHRGYRFIATVGDSPGLAETQLSPRTATARETEVRKLVPRTVVMAGFSIVLVLTLLFALNVDGWRERLLGTRSHTIRSIAVLPLENLSGDTEQEYFADGMTEELITQLGRMGDLRVVSRTSVNRYKHTKKSLQEIARELGVDALVEGAVEHSGDHIRVTANLVQAFPERHLWAESYERDLRDVLVLQGDIARAIAREIRVEVTPQEKARLSVYRPVDPEAHEAYLKGLYFWNQRTEEGLNRGLDYFHKAIELDPNYPHGYAGLADSYAVLGYRGYLAPQEAFPKAKAAALKALELDDGLADAHTSLAAVTEIYDHDWAGAEKEFKRAIELNPGYANAHHWYALHLDEMGRMDESIAEIKRALELDPLSMIINVNLAALLYYARRYDQAIEQIHRALEIDPNFHLAHAMLGMVYEQKGMNREAIAEYEKSVKSSEGNSFRPSGTLGRAYALAGRRNEALKIVEELQALSKRRYVAPRGIADIYIALGDKDQAFAWLEKEVFAGYGLRTDPRFDSLRSDPRFQALLRRTGLPP
jgi:TolB-like protein/DNA-binding winged helix-turn-helix (wHTH) protein/Tfp pilus assembly protein PilF